MLLPETFGALGFVNDMLPGDDTVAIANMLAAAKYGDTAYLAKSYYVTAFDNHKAVAFEGPGEIVTAVAALNPAPDAGLVRLNIGKDRLRSTFGEENLSRMRWRYRQPNKTMTVHLFGPSTFTDGGGILTDAGNYPS